MAGIAADFALESYRPEIMHRRGERAAMISDVSFTPARDRPHRCACRVANFLALRNGQASVIEFREFAEQSSSAASQALGGELAALACRCCRTDVRDGLQRLDGADVGLPRHSARERDTDLADRRRCRDDLAAVDRASKVPHDFLFCIAVRPVRCAHCSVPVTRSCLLAGDFAKPAEPFLRIGVSWPRQATGFAASAIACEMQRARCCAAMTGVKPSDRHPCE